MTISTVVVPYVAGRLHPETEKWTVESGATLHELSLDHDAYWKALVSWWKRPGDLVVVEHDVVPASGVVEQMLKCSHLWCSSPYAISTLPSHLSYPHCWITVDGVTSIQCPPYPLNSWTADDVTGLSQPHIRRSPAPRWLVLQLTDGLGCVKFSDELKRALPGLMVDAGEPTSSPLDRVPHGDWRYTDVRVSNLLRANAHIPHLHEQSSHLHPYTRVR